MKKPFSLPPSLVLFVSLVLLFLSCKKINEATLLGGDLVPEVDNINTFEATFEAITDNGDTLMLDSTKLAYSDVVALGSITSDPEFGQTAASIYFQIAPTAYGKYPFAGKNPQIDSVVLSLDYVGGYGDTNMAQQVRVYEIAQSTTFNDTTYYSFNQSEFETTGVELGTASFIMSNLNDSISIIRDDTTHVANQLRIRLDDNLGNRFAAYDTIKGGNGAYFNDTLFKNLFRGFALKTDAGTGNGLALFNLATTTKTNLTIYYKVTNGTTIDTAETVFTHVPRYTPTGALASAGGQANSIKRLPAGGWEAYLNNGSLEDDKLYIQSAPGSVGYIKIPALDTFQNKLIHRAELIATRISSASDALFAAPDQLFLDRVKSDNLKDSAFTFNEFLLFNSNTNQWNYSFASFGGALRSDNTYRFNITATVQDIITRKRPNRSMRIYAPFDARPYGLQGTALAPTFIQTIPYPAYGRVVLAGGNYAEPDQKLRLRVIYSNL